MAVLHLFGEPAKTSLRKSSLFFQAFLHKYRCLPYLLAYDICCIAIFLVEKPDVNAWFFDDAFASNNGLQHFIDFKPGYPPLGKLPYTLLYSLFGGGESVIVYNIVVLDLAIYAIYRMLRTVGSPRESKILTVGLAMNPVLIQALSLNHADIPALLLFIMAMYAVVRKNAPGAGIFSGLGFLTKIYPALLLIPAFAAFRKGNERFVLVVSFLCTSMLISAPFLASDPLMYLSTYVSHLTRGPSESIFALMDGYYSHTGFRHPTYEATLYYWQFASVYPASPYDHFRYSWTHPYLRYASLVLQLGFLLVFSITVVAEHEMAARLKKISLALISYFVFSSFWNPLIAIPVYLLVLLVLLGKRWPYQLLAMSSLIVVDSLHYLIWFPGLPLDIHLSLPTIVVTRAIVLSIILLTCWGR